MARKRLLRLNGVLVPEHIGHGFKPLKLYELDYIQGESAALHRRLQVFHHKGCKCSEPDCTRVGHYVIVGKDRFGGIHIDLYTKDFTLMTVDHIFPKGKGGDNTLENKQPMCEPCNTKKSAKVLVYCVKTRAPMLISI